MAADLQPIPIGADVVGMMDHPGREPEQLALHGVQQLQVLRGILGARVFGIGGDAALDGHSGVPPGPGRPCLQGGLPAVLLLLRSALRPWGNIGGAT